MSFDRVIGYSGATTGTIISTTSVTDTTASGTQVTVTYIDNKDGKRKTKTEIGPALYIKYVKSKLSKVEQKNLNQRLIKLQNLTMATKNLGQRAAYEELSKIYYSVVKESEAVSCGYDLYVTKDDIEKFKGMVANKPIQLSLLEHFPRPIPKLPASILEEVKAKGLFDEFWVLYIDYTGEKLKTNKEKIREKDPILFGKIFGKENQFYYITDWVDDFCDLTLSSFVDTMKTKEKDYAPRVVRDLDLDFMNETIVEVKARVDRLNGTNGSNFRQNMAQEDAALKKLTVKKKPWWKIWLGI